MTVETGSGTAKLTYSSYLALDQVLDAQRPRSDMDDELLFIIVHQVHELWFKELLHEFEWLRRSLTEGQTGPVLHRLHRSLAVLKVIVTQVDVADTMVPKEFAVFRDELGDSSGAQSVQFREIEAVLGRRSEWMTKCHPAGSVERRRIETAMSQPTIFDALLRYLSQHAYLVPEGWLNRDVSLPLEPSLDLQKVLWQVYQDGGAAAEICERLVDLDQAVQEWRYRHVQMVQRMIGDQPGTGGSTGVKYLRTTLFSPNFPDLLAVRNMT